MNGGCRRDSGGGGAGGKGERNSGDAAPKPPVISQTRARAAACASHPRSSRITRRDGETTTAPVPAETNPVRRLPPPANRNRGPNPKNRRPYLTHLTHPPPARPMNIPKISPSNKGVVFRARQNARTNACQGLRFCPGDVLAERRRGGVYNWGRGRTDKRGAYWPGRAETTFGSGLTSAGLSPI